MFLKYLYLEQRIELLTLHYTTLYSNHTDKVQEAQYVENLIDVKNLNPLVKTAEHELGVMVKIQPQNKLEQLLSS